MSDNDLAAQFTATLAKINEDYEIQFGLLKTPPETFEPGDLERAFLQLMAEQVTDA